MSVHEVAEAGFGGDAETYERVRPGYPPEVVAWFAENLGIGPGTMVLDLAAGTGKLTRELSALGATVRAAEPVDGMRNVLHLALPSVEVLAATAEALPFQDGAFDAVTVAQAFHWFDVDAASREIARVLRPSGSLGLVWNGADRSTSWVDAVEAVLDGVKKRAPWSGAPRCSDRTVAGLQGFSPAHVATFHHAVSSTVDEVVDRIASVSHVAVLPAEEREEVLGDVRRLLASHPQTAGVSTLRMPYRVDAYWCERA